MQRMFVCKGQSQTHPLSISRPGQRVEYECHILTPTAIFSWILPSGETLPDFTGGTSVGTVRSSSDDQYSATLTGKMEDDDPNSDNFFFNSTLAVPYTMNGSNITCFGTVGQNTMCDIAIITHSGESNKSLILCNKWRI